MTKYFINDEETNEQNFEETLKLKSAIETESTFDDFLDECYPEYRIGSLCVSASKIAHLDKSWYSEALNDQKYADLENIEFEIYNEGRSVKVYDVEFRIDDSEEDE